MILSVLLKLIEIGYIGVIELSPIVLNHIFSPFELVFKIAEFISYLYALISRLLSNVSCTVSGKISWSFGLVLPVKYVLSQRIFGDIDT
jgi:hypothetical protein